MTLSSYLTIGDLAQRSGVAPSALRFYESRGLITSERTQGNQRRFARATLRRVAVIRAAQAVGVSLDEIAAALEALPHGRAPTPSLCRMTRRQRKWICRSFVKRARPSPAVIPP